VTVHGRSQGPLAKAPVGRLWAACGPPVDWRERAVRTRIGGSFLATGVVVSAGDRSRPRSIAVVNGRSLSHLRL